MSLPDQSCTKCLGTGNVEAEPALPHPPTFRRCECVLRQDILANVERGLRGLSKEPPIKSSPLMGRHGESLWVTAGHEFLPHLRHLAIRQPPNWAFKVISDAELVTAWLAPIALRGQDILDADAFKVSTEFPTIPDLVVPPDLVVIRIGIKAARNVAAPEVLAEAINIRFHEGKPTWVWDPPHHPLNPGHMFWSDVVGRSLSRCEHIQGLPTLEKTASAKSGKKPGRRKTGKPRRKTLRGGGDK